MVATSGLGWKLAPCLITLVGQVDTNWPHRDRASDGTIGDSVHQAEGRPRYGIDGYAISGSDHDPDQNGIVCALDIDSDIAPGYTSNDLAIALADSADPRIGYIISRGRIFSNRTGTQPFAWRPYTGADPHTNHLHLSVRHLAAFTDNPAPWNFGAPTASHSKKAVTMYLIQDHRGNVAATDFISKRLIGGKQSAAAQQAKKDAGESVVITNVDNDVFDAIPDAH